MKEQIEKECFFILSRIAKQFPGLFNDSEIDCAKLVNELSFYLQSSPVILEPRDLYEQD